MRSIYPISTFWRTTNYRFSWESDAVGVEYLFMGDSGYQHRQITESNYEFLSVNIDKLNAKPQLKARSGRYRQRNAVPK
ncbi:MULTISPECIES: hypothetical protein [unclassified Anabaena]|uniref:hypothetical protein n=1 Tax=unclassified Anabaena TaxID=2619674 RepID=UPI0030D853CC